MKEAWKGIGLRVIDKDMSCILTGRTWYLEIFKEHMPKEVLGQIITLAGEVPGRCAQFLANPEGNQAELYITPTGVENLYVKALQLQAHQRVARPTDVVIDQGTTLFRIYADEEGNTYPVPEPVYNMIAASFCEADEEYYGAFHDNLGWIYWISTECVFAISPYYGVLENNESYCRTMEWMKGKANADTKAEGCEEEEEA